MWRSPGTPGDRASPAHDGASSASRGGSIACVHGGCSGPVPDPPEPQLSMITLELTPDEREHLVEVLTSALSDLRMEIANTDSQDFREMLKSRKLVLVKVLEAIGG